MMDYDGTIKKNMKNIKNPQNQKQIIGVESIPGVPRSSGRVPGAPWHKKMMKI